MKAIQLVSIACNAALFGSAAIVSAQQPAMDATSGNSSSSAGAANAGPAAPSSERILWDQLHPKYRSGSGGATNRQVTKLKQVFPPDKLPPGSVIVIDGSKVVVEPGK